MLLYTNGKTLGIVEKGNLGAVARHRDDLQALVKEVDALKLRVEQTMLEAGKSALEVGAVASKNRSLKLTKKFRDWKNGSWRRMKRSNIESKRTKKRRRLVLAKS